MNKLFYRLVFNKKLGALVAVSESAKSQGKSSSPSIDANNGKFKSAVAKTVLVAVASAGTLAGLNAHASNTIITPDAKAAAAVKPTTSLSANKSVAVNITAPNSKGLSNNHYSQFDVGTAGVVLKNNKSTVNTAVAGRLAANPNLARTAEAKTILTQVNSNKASVLNGNIEVAGKKADLIIANPSGLQINGAKLINAGKVDLVAGSANIANHAVDSYRIGGGAVVVSGKGLNAAGTDYASIIAKSAKINAQIQAGKQLDVITTTGTKKVSALRGDLATVNSMQHDGDSSGYNLDVSSLGGMYADKIRLIGTERGFGVNNAGKIQARGFSSKNPEDASLIIKTSGDLNNTGEITSKLNNSIKAAGTVTNRKTINSNQNVSIEAGDMRNTGSIVAAKTVRLFARNDESSARIRNTGEIVGGHLDFSTNYLNNTGKIIGTKSDWAMISGQGRGHITNKGGAVIGTSNHAVPSAAAKTVLQKPAGAPEQYEEHTSHIYVHSHLVNNGKNAAILFPNAKNGMIVSTENLVNDRSTINATEVRGHRNLYNMGGTINVQSSGLGVRSGVFSDNIENEKGRITFSGRGDVHANRIENSGHIGAVQGLTLYTGRSMNGDIPAVYNSGEIVSQKGALRVSSARLQNDGQMRGVGVDIRGAFNSLPAMIKANYHSLSHFNASEPTMINHGSIDATSGEVTISDHTVGNFGDKARITGASFDLDPVVLLNSGHIVANKAGAMSRLGKNSTKRIANNGLISSRGNVALTSDNISMDGRLAVNGNLSFGKNSGSSYACPNGDGDLSCLIFKHVR